MADENYKRKLAAIFSADVAGYSRLMGEDEASTVKTLETYKQIMFSLIKQHRGRVIDAPGDNLLAEFASVVDAVQCGVAVQKEFKARNTDLPENRKMQFRIGINLGDVIEEGERIYGEGVNIAARIEELADPGGVSVSRSVFDQVKKRLAFGYADMGGHSVKNIEEPIHVYRVIPHPDKSQITIPFIDRKPKSWHWKGAFIAILISSVVVWFNYQQKTKPEFELASVEKMAHPLPDKPSIAVLPFDNMSGDPSQEYFCDGITEDLITDISKIRGIFVIARNSVFTYKGKSVKISKVAEELGVRYVIEGSIRREGDVVRINAQLIDATTGWHLWAERYDGKMDNVFDLQNSITKKIVSALKVKLTSEVQEQLANKETNNPEAYDAFLKGWTYYRQHKPEDFAMAVNYLKEAIKIDPNYSRANAALALVYWESAQYQRWNYLNISYSEARLKVKEYLSEAMKAPVPLAHSVASQVHKREGRYQQAITEAAHAISLDSSDPDGYRAMAEALIWSGNSTQSIEFIDKAMRLDPNNTSYYMDLLGIAQFNLEQFENAKISLEKYTKTNPEAEWTYLWLAATNGHLGQHQDAKSAIDSFNKRIAKLAWNYMSTLESVEVLSLKDLRDEERLSEGLRIAGIPPGIKPFAEATELISLTKEGHFKIEGVPTIEAQTAKTLLEQGVITIDVRPNAFWNSGHIPGAIHLNDSEVFGKHWLSKIVNKDQAVVFYCEGAG